MNTQARLNFYYSFLYPYLSYNVVVWGNTFKTHLHPIIIQQKQIIRLIAGANYLAHTNALFHEYEVLKFEDIYKYCMSLYMFSAMKKGLYLIEHSINTRNRNQASSTHHRLSTTQHSVSFEGPRLWNQLPQSLRNIESLYLFKIKLKRHVIQQYIN